MRKLALRSIRANPVRFVATALAVIVATGFLAGTLILRDSLGASLETSTRNQLRGVDAAVQNDLGLAPAAAADTPSGSTPGTAPGAGGTEPSSTAPSGERRERTEMNDGPGGRQLGLNQKVPATLLPTVAGATGVRDAAGVLSGYISVLDGRGGSIAENIVGSLWVPVDDLNPYVVVEGRPPERAGEVAVDARTVDAGSLTIGGPLQLATSQGERPATLVGVVNFGDQPASGQGDVVLSADDAFAWLNDGRPEYSAIYVAGDDGVTPDALVKNLEATVGGTYTVETGDRLRENATSGLGTVVNVISGALIGFAVVALFVALFTIYNTFSIIVAQRTQEFALLRALGASGKQVKRSVRTEAALLGLGASVIGVGVGLLLFMALTRVIGQVREIVGSVTLKLSPVSILLVLLIGTVVTVVSAIVPAWRAASTKPLEALRAVAIDRSGTSRFRAGVGLVMLGLGVVILLIGATAANFLVMLAGPPFLFLGVIVGGPVLASAFGTVVHGALRPLRRTTLKLGVENVQRNPRRSSATALALVIGVFLVVLVTAGGGAVRDYAVSQVSQLGGPDVTVFAAGTGLPSEYVRQVRAVDGVTAVAEVFPTAAMLDATGLPASGVDFADARALNLSYLAGDPATLGKDDVIVPDFGPQQPIGKVGDPLTVTFANGETRTVRVGAVVKPAIPFPVFLSAELVREVDPALVPASLQISAESGRVQDVTGAITRVTRSFAGVEVVPGNFFAQAIKNLFNFVITAANGLLGVAVVIALFGIVNTLVLSVTERTHEIGLLRAVGMTRGQVSATIRLEAVAVSLLGALVGTVFGLFVAWCLTRPILNQEGETATGFSWPVSQLALILVLAVIVGVAASLVPAYRASRLNIIEAVRTD